MRTRQTQQPRNSTPHTQPSGTRCEPRLRRTAGAGGPVYHPVMDRIVVKPRVQIAVAILILAVFMLLGLLYFTELDVVAERNWFGIGLALVCLVGGGVGVWRALRMGVVIDRHGVRVRGFDSRDQVTPWSEVDMVDCAQVDARAGLPVHAPVLVLAGGAVEPVTVLGSYSRSDAERKVERLRELKAEHDGGTGRP